MNNQQIAKLVADMVATAQTKRALALTDIKNLSSKVTDAENQRFINSVALGQKLFETKEQFEEFFVSIKNKLKDNGTTAKEMISKADFVKLVYGFKASYYYKLIKIGELPKHVVNKFIKKCDEAEKDGKDFARSIEALNTWAKNFEEHKGEADADTESISDLRNGGDKKVAKSSFKFENIKVTFYTDGSFDTNSTALEIREAFELLTISITSTFPLPKQVRTKKVQTDLGEIQKKRVAKLPVSKELI
jgi:cyclopropane fatty-acyl-phospholipid synthase-like methyltransferase